MKRAATILLWATILCNPADLTRADPSVPVQWYVNGPPLRIGNSSPGVALSQNGRFMATMSHKRANLAIWDTVSAARVCTLASSVSPRVQEAIMYLGNRNWLIAFTRPGSVGVFDSVSGACLREIPVSLDNHSARHHIAADAQGNTVALVDKANRQICIVDPGGGTINATLPIPPWVAHTLEIRLNREGTIVYMLCSSVLGNDVVYDIVRLAVIGSRELGRCRLSASVGSLQSVTLSVFGNYCAVSYDTRTREEADGQLNFVDTASGRIVGIVRGVRTRCDAATFTNDERLFAAPVAAREGDCVGVYVVDGGRQDARIPVTSETVHSSSFSQDGSTLALSTWFGVRLWDMWNGCELPATAGPDAAWNVKLDRSERLVLSQGLDGVRVWDERMRIPIWERRGGRLATFVEGSDDIIMLSHSSVERIDIQTDSTRWKSRFKGDDDCGSTMCYPNLPIVMFEQRGKCLLSMGGARLWMVDMVDGTCEAVTCPTDTIRVGNIAVRDWHESYSVVPMVGFVSGVAQERDREKAADSLLWIRAFLFDPRSRRFAPGPFLQRAHAASVSPDGRQTVMLVEGQSKTRVVVFSLNPSRRLAEWDFGPWKAGANELFLDNQCGYLTISAAAGLIAIAGDDGLVHVLDTITGNEVGYTQRGEYGDVVFVGFSRSGSNLVTSYSDGSIVIWGTGRGSTSQACWVPEVN